MIYVSPHCGESNYVDSIPFFKSIREVVNAFVLCFGATLAHGVFSIYLPHLPAIAIFGHDGHLKTKLSNLSLKDHGVNVERILCGRDDMDEEFHKELLNRYHWDLDRVITLDFFCRE